MELFAKIKSLLGTDQETTEGDGLILKKGTKVTDLKKQFNERFGSVLRVYVGRSQVDENSTLGEAGLTNEGIFECRGNLQVGTFIAHMAEEYGLKVKVYTVDEWVAVIDGLTLSASGIVKKSATKADMEMMLSGGTDNPAQAGKTPVSEVKAGAFAIVKYSDNSYSVSIDGNVCANSKGAMRQLAEAIGFEYDKGWTTQQFGAKLSKFIKENAGVEEAPVAVEEAVDKPVVKKVSKKDGELPGVFVLEDGRKICFSRGNLQFHCKNYEFKFAEEQYETIGEGNKNIAPNYDGWIDLFGWGTSGYMGCQPTEVSTINSEYGPAKGNIAGTKYDWGVFNPITNGGNKEGVWRTPTYDEMQYLFARRSNADKLKIFGTVCGIQGVILLTGEEFWNNRLRFPIDLTSVCNVFDAEKWDILENLGCVFFPDCLQAKSQYERVRDYDSYEIDGCKNVFKEIVYSPDCRRYSTSSREENEERKYFDSFTGSYRDRTCDRRDRLPVRLIKDIE